MGTAEDWFLFLEKNPHFYEMSKGDFFIKFLESLVKDAKSFSDLMVLFSRIEEDDLQLIMETLLELKVVSSVKIGSKFFYTITEEGKKLLAEYKKTKRFYST